MTQQERQDMWERLKGSKTVSSGIDQMLAIDMVLLLKENERLQKELDQWRNDFMAI